MLEAVDILIFAANSHYYILNIVLLKEFSVLGSFRPTIKLLVLKFHIEVQSHGAICFTLYLYKHPVYLR